MKFLCSNCKAKYQIADEKVSGRTLRMTCRQCKQEIVIRGDSGGVAPARTSIVQPPTPSIAAAPMPAMPPSPLVPSPLAMDFQRQLAGAGRTSLAPPPVLDAWHVAINEIPVGPMRREDVARRIASGAVNSESLAWREGLDDWLPLRQIPELASLLGGAAPPPVAFVPAMPQQRADMAPVGGRGGAGPAFSLEDWAPPPVDPATAHAMRQPVTVVESSSAAKQPWGAMFLGACVFAFLMAVTAIIGAKWLKDDDEKSDTADATASAAATGTTAPAQPTIPTQPPAAEQQQADPEMVIELDDIGMEGNTARPRTGGSSRNTASTTTSKPSGGKKDLTDAEKAMLARMGGGTDPALSELGGGRSTSTRSTGGGASAGSLTAEQLSKVVMQGRKNLQRCYETALRGSGSDDTIRLDVEITISPSGNVTNVKTGDGGLPGMKECVQRTVKMWRFPNAGDSTQTKFPLVFQPGG